MESWIRADIDYYEGGEDIKIMEIRRILENERTRLTIELELFLIPDSSSDRSLSPFNKKMEAASQIAEFDQRRGKERLIRQQMADIEHALEKIRMGTYGICDECRKPIAPERLKVIPQANLCLTCKSRQNRRILGYCVR